MSDLLKTHNISIIEMTNEHSILGIYKKVFDYLAAGFAIIYGVEMDGNNVKRKMAKLNETVSLLFSNLSAKLKAHLP